VPSASSLRARVRGEMRGTAARGQVSRWNIWEAGPRLVLVDAGFRSKQVTAFNELALRGQGSPGDRSGSVSHAQ
jgi:hypothetical protein